VAPAAAFQETDIFPADPACASTAVGTASPAA
jgi:hypothetical protein